MPVQVSGGLGNLLLVGELVGGVGGLAGAGLEVGGVGCELRELELLDVADYVAADGELGHFLLGLVADPLFQ